MLACQFHLEYFFSLTSGSPYLWITLGNILINGWKMNQPSMTHSQVGEVSSKLQAS